MPRCGCQGKPALYSSGLSLRKSSSSRNGSNSLGVAEAEGAAQMHAGAFHGRLGLDDLLHGTDGHDALPFCDLARMRDLFMRPLATGLSRATSRATSAANWSRKLFRNSRVLSSVTVPSSSIRPGLNCDIGLAAHQQNALRAEDLAQVLLRQRRADRARRGAGDGRELAGPGVLAPRPRAPVDGVLQHRRDRAAVLGRDEQQRRRPPRSRT